ncbi:MAG TPA: 8-oxo-dGTP diphosphatase [Candidatus Saccharimonadales bacterium]|nr:8-oxo-dGTP diphosphatase [Candidatus Saccharimonadales bacterium]
MKVCTLVFLRRDNEVLLAMKKRGFGAGRWNGVGGKVAENETIEQAMIRECQEEISVIPRVFTKVAYHDFINDATAEPWHQAVHVYMCSEWQGEPRESEEMAPRWFKLSKIPYNDMWQDDQMWLPLVLQNKLVQSTFTFDEHDDILSAKIDLVDRLAA